MSKLGKVGIGLSIFLGVLGAVLGLLAVFLKLLLPKGKGIDFYIPKVDRGFYIPMTSKDFYVPKIGKLR